MKILVGLISIIYLHGLLESNRLAIFWEYMCSFWTEEGLGKKFFGKGLEEVLYLFLFILS